jgi:hypothetical protein
MKKRYTGISIATALLMVSPIISGTAFAEPVNGDTPQIDSVISQYGKQIQSSYSGIGVRSLNESKQEQIAQQNGGGLYNPADDGLNLEKADVSTQVISAVQSGNGYKARIIVTTNLHMTPKPGTTITIVGEKRDSLDSSGTDEHVVTLAPNGAEGTHGYSVVNDQPQLPHDENNTLENSDSATTGSPQDKADSATPQVATPMSNTFANRVGLDYVAEEKYADLWTNDAHVDKKDHDPDIMNHANGLPDFPDNCTNFVSQALYFGGLKMKSTTFNHRQDNNVWAYKGTLQLAPTYTWGGAQNNYSYMSQYSHAFTVENNPDHLGGGAVLYADWEGDGILDHAAIVTGNISHGSQSTAVICQKSHNHHNEPMTFLVNYQKKKYPGKHLIWRGLQWAW